MLSKSALFCKNIYFSFVLAIRVTMLRLEALCGATWRLKRNLTLV